jgi:protein transport protein SEC61 subunit gamma-like protein
LAGKSRDEGGIISSIRATLHDWRLILQRVKKPDRDEFIQASKIIWLAIVLVGSVAYLLHLVAVKILAG